MLILLRLRCAGNACALLGCILLAVADSESFNVFAVALVFLGLGGTGHHMAAFHLSNLNLNIKGLVITLVVSSFVRVDNHHTIMHPLLSCTKIKSM